jgi:hypothetical protein
MKRSKLVCSTVLVAAALALGCADKADEAAETKKEEDLGPPVQVQLPPTPNFDEGITVEKYDDGSYSIYGLRKNLDENVNAGMAGTEVTLKGWVQSVYTPPECPEGELCPPGKQAHVWLTDKQDEKGRKRAMMVVNYRFNIPEWDAARWKDLPEVVLEVGKRYTFKGKFKRFSDTGFSHDRGLFEFVAYKPHDPETGAELSEWVYPPGSSWHPIEIQRQEEENARLIERASAAAEGFKKDKE